MSAVDALVLFDIDGTIMRGAGEHHKKALISGVRTVAGVTTTLDGIATTGTLDSDLIIELLRGAGYGERRARKILGQVMIECGNAFVTDCDADLAEKVCAGVVDLIADLKRRGAVLGLVTGNLSRIGWRKMELAGLRDAFSVGAFAEQGRTRTRLARAAAQNAIRNGLVTKRARISLIGDHSNDILAAKANSFQSVAVATGIMPYEELKEFEPDILVHNLNELDRDALFNPV